MSRWTSIKITTSARHQLEAFRDEAIRAAGPRGKRNLPPASWFQEASLSCLLEFLAMMGQERMLWRQENGARVEEGRRRVRLARRAATEYNEGRPQKEAGTGGQGASDTLPFTSDR